MASADIFCQPNLTPEPFGFNRHRDFIVALLKHPPARRVLFRATLA